MDIFGQAPSLICFSQDLATCMPTYEERLRHIVLKIQQAREHSARLDEHLRAFLATNPYKVEVRQDNLTRRPIYFVAAVEPVPDLIPLVAGDILQNLVVALDHLAYQLVCNDTQDQPPNPNWIYFPIADDQEKYDAKKSSKLAGASPATIAAIDALMPYKGGDNILWTLYRLNNIEKHRLLLTVGSQAAGIHLGQLIAGHLSPGFSPEAVKMVQEMPHFLMPADKGFPLTPGFDLYSGGPDEPINPSLKFRFEVALNEPGIAEGKEISNVVLEMAARVETVVEALTPLLK
jgi:hypothetical protein